MIVKAKVLTGSASDAQGCGRVELQSSGLWVRSMLTPVVGNVPLNEGDIVFVDISCGDDSPLVLGRCRDLGFSSHGDVGSAYSVLWDSVSADGSTWSVAYVEGSHFVFESSTGMVFTADGSTVSVHTGSNGGVVNIGPLRSFMQAVQKDLIAAKSGSNVIEWMSSPEGLSALEDKSFNH